MSSTQSFVDFILDQLQGEHPITARKMFGEYALYCDGKVVALVCDNNLFIKPTDGGRAFIGDVVEAPPYPSAKNSFLISESQIEDRDWLKKLIDITARELPIPKEKKKKAAKK